MNHIMPNSFPILEKKINLSCLAQKEKTMFSSKLVKVTCLMIRKYMKLKDIFIL